MQSSSSSTSPDINQQQTPYKLNVFLFGQDSRSVKQYPTYSYQRHFSMDDEDSDDDHLILSGKFFFFSLFNTCQPIGFVFISIH